MHSWQRTAAIVATVGSGVMAGLYFAFSTFVMPGFRRLPAEQGIAAMKLVNRAAPAPFVVVGLLLTGGACGVTLAHALTHGDDAASPWRVAGVALYAATLVLTFAYHVPRNNALDRLAPSAADASSFWTSYVHGWTLANHLRFALAAAATVALARALQLDTP